MPKKGFDTLIAACALLGGWLADRWTRRTPRGRIYTSAIGMGLIIALALFIFLFFYLPDYKNSSNGQNGREYFKPGSFWRR